MERKQRTFPRFIRPAVAGSIRPAFINPAFANSGLRARTLALAATLLLLGTQFVLSILLGLLLGVISAHRRASLVDQAVSVLSLVGMAVPAFWLAQMMMLVFSLELDLLPAQGMHSLRYDLSGMASFLDLLQHLALPALTLTIFNLALIARVTRASMLGTLRMEYVTFARSKGHCSDTLALPSATVTAVAEPTIGSAFP